MSKMGRHVYRIQEQEERELYDNHDREECTDAATHPLARATLWRDGGRRLVPRTPVDARLPKRGFTAPEGVEIPEGA